MKKVFSLLAVLALVCMASSAWAAGLGDSTPAYATFTGGSISFSATPHPWEGTYAVNASTNAVNWNSPNITLGSSDVQWKNADVYCLIESTITSATGKVYVYTKNKTNAAPYTATNGYGSGTNLKYDGLVRANSGGGNTAATTSNFAPIIFQLVPLSTAKAQWNSGQPPITGEAYGRRYLTDFDNFDKDLDYMAIATAAGIWEGLADEGWDNYTKEPHVMFFGAGFKYVLGGESFGTTTIIFNSSVE